MVPKQAEDLTREWFSEHLTEGVFAGVGFASVEIQPVGSDVGFLGDICRVIPSYTEANGPWPKSLIAKFPTVRQANLETGRHLLAYEREALFYRHAANGCPADPPQHYFSIESDSPGDYLIFIEDLEGGRFVKQVDGLAFEDAIEAMAALARMHAHYWQSADIKNKPWLYDFSQWAQIYPASIESGWPLFERDFGYLISDHLKPVFPPGNAAAAQLFNYLSTDRPVTLIHGDARMENLCFDPVSGKARYYDWQLVSSGPAAYDVMYFIASGLEPEEILARGDELIQHYHKALLASGVTDYGLTDLKQDMELTTCLLFGFTSMVGNIMADPGEAERAVVEATFPRYQVMMELFNVRDIVPELHRRLGQV